MVQAKMRLQIQTRLGITFWKHFVVHKHFLSIFKPTALYFRTVISSSHPDRSHIPQGPQIDPPKFRTVLTGTLNGLWNGVHF